MNAELDLDPLPISGINRLANTIVPYFRELEVVVGSEI
jgi:hypothetical protein